VRKKQIQVAIDSLRREIDSLEAVRRSIIADPKVQERIAREEFGMVRGDKEILYRFAEPALDTAR
jgi:cell division protein FtsB